MFALKIFINLNETHRIFFKKMLQDKRLLEFFFDLVYFFKPCLKIYRSLVSHYVNIEKAISIKILHIEVRLALPYMKYNAEAYFTCVYRFRDVVSIVSIYLSMYLSVCLSVYLSIFISIYLLIYLSIYLVAGSVHEGAPLLHHHGVHVSRQSPRLPQTRKQVR